MTDVLNRTRGWSIASAMIVTAAAALLAAAMRGGNGRGTVGAVVVGCTLLLALVLYRDTASRRTLQDPAAAWRRKVVDALGSLGSAALIVGLSDLAFLVGFLAWAGSKDFDFRRLVRTGRCWIGPEPPSVEACMAAGLVLGLPVTRSLRSVLPILGTTGWWRLADYSRLWPVALTLALLAWIWL